MAKLFQVTEESVDSVVHATPITKLYGATAVSTAREISSKANLTLESKTEDGVETYRVVSEDLATVVAGINAAEGPVRSLNLSVVNDNESPTANFVPYNKLFVAEAIVEVFANPANAAESVVITREYKEKRGVQLIVNDTVANILAAANA